ncbi:PREDICTED: uncharacterized protein LOC105457035 [Wasmannia auropunctata]|uniref:uncharacterized protein LOC105457035 n=1 Tax=Wasmannia auropunctata TaxID=64793 RepID=UPI0005F00958|nr:PREDICTED: uncharacterized protein LOC105457035 [Wasmannia auropunctata]
MPRPRKTKSEGNTPTTTALSSPSSSCHVRTAATAAAMSSPSPLPSLPSHQPPQKKVITAASSSPTPPPPLPLPPLSSHQPPYEKTTAMSSLPPPLPSSHYARNTTVRSPSPPPPLPSSHYARNTTVRSPSPPPPLPSSHYARTTLTLTSPSPPSSHYARKTKMVTLSPSRYARRSEEEFPSSYERTTRSSSSSHHARKTAAMPQPEGQFIQKFQEACDKRSVIHDMNLRFWVLEAKDQVDLPKFKSMTWFNEVYLLNTGRKSILLLDSWTGYCPSQLELLIPQDKEIQFATIPKKTTSIIQPLDLYDFRIWNNFVRTFSDNIILQEIDINLHSPKPLVQRIKQFNGCYGCSYCTHPGYGLMPSAEPDTSPITVKYAMDIGDNFVVNMLQDNSLTYTVTRIENATNNIKIYEVEDRINNDIRKDMLQVEQTGIEICGVKGVSPVSSSF